MGSESRGVLFHSQGLELAGIWYKRRIREMLWPLVSGSLGGQPWKVGRRLSHQVLAGFLLLSPHPEWAVSCNNTLPRGCILSKIPAAEISY